MIRQRINRQALPHQINKQKNSPFGCIQFSVCQSSKHFQQIQPPQTDKRRKTDKHPHQTQTAHQKPKKCQETQSRPTADQQHHKDNRRTAETVPDQRQQTDSGDSATAAPDQMHTQKQAKRSIYNMIIKF